MDWFERITGFRETGYEETRRRLEVNGPELRSRVNGRSYAIGELELVCVHTLRERAQGNAPLPGRLRVGVVKGDVRRLHQAPQFSGALFQVASQFNLLEMVSPNVTPEQGVTRYADDPTQGPACATAAGAATIYRNYFAMTGGEPGQTARRQLDGLADLGSALAQGLGKPVDSLWEMRNGYALCTRAGLDSIADYLANLDSGRKDALRDSLRIGLHTDVEVTDASGDNRPRVSQAFCSALPVAYTNVAPRHWQPFASLVLEGAYEATLLAAVLNAQRGASNIVLLTRLGGGAFGNQDEWIDAAIRSALEKFSAFELDVRIVSRGTTSQAISELARDFG